jgi:hypothetical protein
MACWPNGLDSISGRSEKFLSSLRPARLCGLPSILYNVYRGRLPPGFKQPGREADHFPPVPDTSSWHDKEIVLHFPCRFVWFLNTFSLLILYYHRASVMPLLDRLSAIAWYKLYDGDMRTSPIFRMDLFDRNDYTRLSGFFSFFFSFF